MNKELFVSTTPHETKVGITEDDQLAEIYLERENEYTLAGSIYKGRVTRVLPGMQSAFVDIGLERDAFLYVSDFMELEEHDEDVSDVVPVSRGVQTAPHAAEPQAQPAAESPAPSTGPSFVIESEGFEENEETGATVSEGQAPAEANHAAEAAGNGGQERESRGWRGRRRRRGGRRGERSLPESRFARPADSSPAPHRPPERPSRSNYGPPPGYQPIILPGES